MQYFEFSSIRQLLYFKIKFLVFVKSKLKFAYDHLKSNEFRYEKSNYKTKYKAFRQDLKTTFRRSKQAGGSKLFGWAHQNRRWPLKASIGTKKKGREKEKRSPESRTSRVVHADLQSLITYAVQHFMRQVPVVISYVPSPLLSPTLPLERVHASSSCTHNTGTVLGGRVFLPRNEPLLDGCSLPPVRRPKINEVEWSGAEWSERASRVKGTGANLPRHASVYA